MVAGTSRAFAASGSTLKADLIKEAALFCTKQNKTLLLKNSEASDMVFGRSAANSEIIFSCLSEHDSENTRPNFDKVMPKQRVEIEVK